MLAKEVKIGDKIYIVYRNYFNIAEVSYISGANSNFVSIYLDWVINPSQFADDIYLYKKYNESMDYTDGDRCITTNIDKALKFLEKHINKPI